MTGGGPRGTSLQRRLLLYLLVCAPLVWSVTLVFSAYGAREEVNELFDTEIIRLAREVQSTLAGLAPVAAGATATVPPGNGTGAAELGDLAIAAWDRQGRLMLVDREGVSLPYRRDASGFVNLPLGGEPWRAYYLQSNDGAWLVAAAQRAGERDELVWSLVLSQLLPWVAMLPVLLLVMAWAVRRALAPVRRLAGELTARSADSLQPLAAPAAPLELQPLVVAMNGLFTRIDAARQRERRFTADAAHELRTPLALLRAQWDLLRSAPDNAARADAESRLESGIARMDRLVSQMLALSRLDAAEQLPSRQPVAWAAVVEEAISDTLALAGRRRVELACDWPAPPADALPLQGDAGLLGVMLRNLLDNAVRYAPAGSTVSIAFTPDALTVANAGPPLAPEVLAQLGERFQRRAGQAESGSGLGVSIVMRIAALHGLALRHTAGPGGQGVVAHVERAAPARGAATAT